MGDPFICPQCKGLFDDHDDYRGHFTPTCPNVVSDLEFEAYRLKLIGRETSRAVTRFAKMFRGTVGRGPS